MMMPSFVLKLVLCLLIKGSHLSEHLPCFIFQVLLNVRITPVNDAPQISEPLAS